MLTTRWSVRCAALVTLTCAPVALVAMGDAWSTVDAASNPALSADDDVTGPAVAVQQAVRVSPPTTTTIAPKSSSTSSTSSTSTSTVAGGSTTTTVAGTSALVFPMQPTPYCLMLDNYGDSRSGGTRTHQGTDIMGYYKWTADQLPNQEVYAVVDGTLGAQKIDGQSDAALSGNSWRLYSVGSSTYYMYAHLSRFADGLVNGSVVKQGQLIGYVGDTGDPGKGNFHLHFEVHPTGNSNVVVDPMPILKPVIPPECDGS